MHESDAANQQPLESGYTLDLDPTNLANQTIRLLIADDNEEVLQGLVLVLNLEPDLEICGEAVNGREAVELAQQTKPDLCLLDYKMPYLSGVAAGTKIKSLVPGSRVLIITGIDADEAIFSALESGVDGYILKEVAPDELLRAIRTVASGEAYLHPVVTRKVLGRMNRYNSLKTSFKAVESNNSFGPIKLNPSNNKEGNETYTGEEPEQALSKRELEVLRGIALGQTNREIGNTLALSEETIRTYTKNIFRKLQVDDRTKAAVIALKRNLISFS